MLTRERLESEIRDIVNRTQVVDMHTHLFAPDFGDLMLAGVDELLTYHYLVAEVVRASNCSYADFWGKTKRQQAEFIWETLFCDRTPVSEATRGVVTTLHKLGMDLTTRDLASYRESLAVEDSSAYVDRVFSLAGVQQVVMTNDPFDQQEREMWMHREEDDDRFLAALRIDPLLNSYSESCGTLQELGFDVQLDLAGKSISEIRRFLTEWIERMGALYVAVSLPQDFVYPEESVRGRLIREAVLPVCEEQQIPMALMIGVKRGVNAELQSAGDSVGKADIDAVANLCSSHPGNRFMVTMLSRENQHELAVTARKFPNLMVFGCWWFLNNPSLIQEITKMRVELLGPTFVPQHSDARILDQLVYKWSHSRAVIVRVLLEKYTDLWDAGWTLERADIERDVEAMLHKNAMSFIKGRALGQ